MPLITEQQLKAIFPYAKTEKVKFYTEAFNRVFPKYGLDTHRRIAAFLGQIGVESGELKYDRELPSKWNKKNPGDPNEPIGTLYEGRTNLGNKMVGDGPKYIGRGIIQLTGRANYATMSGKIGYDLVNNPELACNAEISTRIACQYFKDRGILEYADVWDLSEVTRRVNGNARLHHKERVAYSEKALQVLSSTV